MAIVHQIQVIVPDFTGVARLADEILTEHLGKHKIGVIHPRDSGRTSYRVRGIAEGNVTFSELILRMNLEPTSTATTVTAPGSTPIRFCLFFFFYASSWHHASYHPCFH
jgi:hypothetical protein